MTIFNPVLREPVQVAPVRRSGVVVFFDRKKGYGFISSSSGEDVYFHASALEKVKRKELKCGDRVTFTAHDGAKRPVAKGVRLEG